MRSIKKHIQHPEKGLHGAGPIQTALRVVLCLALLTALPVRAEALLLDCPHCSHVPASMATGHVPDVVMPADHDVTLPDCCREDDVQVMSMDHGMVHATDQDMHAGLVPLAAVAASASRNAVPLDQCVCSADQSVPPLAASASLGTGHGSLHANGVLLAAAISASCPLPAGPVLKRTISPPGALPSQPLFLHTRALLL